MTLETYQEKALRTLAILPSIFHDDMHMLLGMTSELEELFNASDIINAGEELSDENWYVANYATLHNIQLHDHFTYQNDFYNPIVGGFPQQYDIALTKEISKLSDIEKKQMAYKKIFSEEKRLEMIINILKALNDCFKIRNLDPHRFLNSNIAKLQQRYPDKFSEENAVNRDLLAERQILEN